MEKLNKILWSVTLVILSVVITFIVTASYMHNMYSQGYVIKGEDKINISQNNTNSSTSKFPILESVCDILSNSFYEDVDKIDLEEAAIRGMLNSLNDPYTYYMDPEEYGNFTADVLGNYTGIGLHLLYNVQENKIEVLAPIKDTPAYKADIKTGDFVIAVNGTTYTGEQMQSAVNVIKGKAGEKVTLTIERNGETFDIDVVRKDINIKQLEYEIIDGDIGYIEILTFDEDIHVDFVNAYNDLINSNIKGLIIDVRDNPGGVLGEVIKIADMIVPKGIIVYTMDRNNTKVEYKSNTDGIDIPLVVLINGSSASASEILAGAIKDHGVGTIVGTKTYGKGLVQRTFLLDNEAVIKITTDEFFTPNGNKINKEGILPDVEVELSSDAEVDLQLEKAIEILNK